MYDNSRFIVWYWRMIKARLPQDLPRSFGHEPKKTPNEIIWWEPYSSAIGMAFEMHIQQQQVNSSIVKK